MMRHFPKSATPMEALRTGVSSLSMFDPESEDGSPEANTRKAIRLTAQIATVVAAVARLRDGNEPMAPRSDLGHAGNFYFMLTGETPNETIERALQQVGGNRSAAARRLGVSRRALYRRLDAFGLR